MRRFSVLMALLGSFALATPTVSFAQDKAELKADYKEAKSAQKTLDKAAGKWLKGMEKEKDSLMEKADEDLVPWYRSELKRLRELGVPSKKAEPYVIEGHEEKVIVPEPERPKLEGLRDLLVDLRDLQDGKARGPKYKESKAAILKELQKIYSGRTERKKTKFKEA